LSYPRLLKRSFLHIGNFVSSPYHMRGIKLIAEKVFRDRTNSSALRLYFVSPRYETPRLRRWFLKTRGLKFVSSEYAKMAWFLSYIYFVGS